MYGENDEHKLKPPVMSIHLLLEMAYLAEKDPVMLDLLNQAVAYYYLKSPKSNFSNTLYTTLSTPSPNHKKYGI